jgi:hypothetical protein
MSMKNRRAQIQRAVKFQGRQISGIETGIEFNRVKGSASRGQETK